MTIKGLAVDSHHLLVWNGKDISVFLLHYKKECVQVSNFPSRAINVALYQDSLYMAQEDQLIITNLEGVQQISVLFSDKEGRPLLLHGSKHFISIATDQNYFKLLDVSKKDPQNVLLIHAKEFMDTTKTNNSSSNSSSSSCMSYIIKFIQYNSNRTRISILLDRVLLSESTTLYFREPDTCMYVYDVSRDVMEHIDFAHNGRVPIYHCWDSKEPNLLSCETHKTDKISLSKTDDGLTQKEDPLL